MALVSRQGWRIAFREFLQRRVISYLPFPHFMMLAPVDVILRLLLSPPAAISWRYWPRLALIVALSAVVTIITLPERLALALWLRIRPPVVDKTNAPIFVLGYFRSGTTFLQSLLAADPSLNSPSWVATLAPQGFVLSWTLLRLLMAPLFLLMPITPRMNTVTPFGPGTPAEDEFALSNWALASILPGRTVLPQAQRFYNRFDSLDELTPMELSRWRRYLLAFFGKLLLASGGRRLVLKSPSHTARVDRLRALFPGAKFVHISRPPATVFRSNQLLVRTLQSSFRLQDPLPDTEQDEIILNEYLVAEKRYLAAKANVAPGDLAEVRLQDLIADPMSEIERIYRDLDLPMSDAFRSRLRVMLASTRDGERLSHADLTEDETRRIGSRLDWLAETFGHNRPAIPRVAAPVPLAGDPRPRRGIAALVATAVALVCLAAWVGIMQWTGGHQGWLAWPVGFFIGYGALRSARSGSWKLGAWSASVAAATIFSGAFLYIWMSGYGSLAGSFLGLASTTLQSFPAGSMLLWTALGVAMAYGLGSSTRI